MRTLSVSHNRPLYESPIFFSWRRGHDLHVHTLSGDSLARSSNTIMGPLQTVLAEVEDLETPPEDAIPGTNSFQDCPLAFRVKLPKRTKTR